MPAVELDCPQEIPAEEVEVVYSAEGMALDNRFDGLDRRVGDIEKDLKQIERKLPPPDFPFAAVAASVASIPSSTNWLKRNSHWFPILTPIITVVLIVLGVVSGLFTSSFDTRITTKLNEPNGLNARIQELSSDIKSANGELRAIRMLWETQLKKTGDLKAPAFKMILPQAAEVLKAAYAMNIPSTPTVLESIRQNFLEVRSSAPGYWPAASNFIAYRSAQQAPRALYLLRPQPYNLPPEQCNAQIPFAVLRPGEPKKEPLPANLELCVFDLSQDIPPGWIQLKAMDYGPGAFRFNDCVIKYQGGPIPKNVLKIVAFAVFDKCIFAFSFDTPPSSSGMLLSHALLESTSDTIKGLVKLGG